MGIGVSVALIAVGAVLTWATSASVGGVGLSSVGVILMLAGALALLVALVRAASS